MEKKLEGHNGSIFTLSYSPDGRYLASGSVDKTIRIWNLQVLEERTQNKTVKILEGHTDWIRTLAYSPDGKYLVSGGYDKTIRIWDLENGTVKILEGHTCSIYILTYSPDGKYLASGGYDKTIRIWDLETRETIQLIFEQQNIINSLVYSPNGKYLVSGCMDKIIRIYNLKTIPLLVAPQHSLKQLVLSGLEQTGIWNTFLQQELYDPRMLILIQSFLQS